MLYAYVGRSRQSKRTKRTMLSAACLLDALIFKALSPRTKEEHEAASPLPTNGRRPPGCYSSNDFLDGRPANLQDPGGLWLQNLEYPSVHL